MALEQEMKKLEADSKLRCKTLLPGDLLWLAPMPTTPQHGSGTRDEEVRDGQETTMQDTFAGWLILISPMPTTRYHGTGTQIKATEYFVIPSVLFAVQIHYMLNTQMQSFHLVQLVSPIGLLNHPKQIDIFVNVSSTAILRGNHFVNTIFGKWQNNADAIARWV